MLERLRTVEGYELVTVTEAAKLCGVTYGAIHRWMQDGHVRPMYRAGKTLLIDKKEVQAAADSYQRTKPRSGTPQAITEGASAQG